MITTLVAASVMLGTGSHAHAGCCTASDPHVAAIVARAWAQVDTDTSDLPPIDPKFQKEIERDIELGRTYSKEVEKELKLSADAEMIARVERIGGSLAKIANETPARVTWGDRRFAPFPYSFKVVQGKDVNAFSLPGGFIYVYEGLLNYVESDHELAGILGHEIAHAAFRHVATLQREQSKMSLIQLPLILIAIMGGSRNQGGAIDLLNASQLVQQAVGSGWSQQAETAADYGGFQYLQKSEWNPTGLLTFMERLARDEKVSSGIDLGIYRTHPPSRQRADALTRYLREAGVPIRRSLVTTTFRVVSEPKEDGTVEVRFGKRPLFSLRGENAKARAAEVLPRLNAFFDEVPELFEVRADGSRVMGRGRPLIEFTPADAPEGQTANQVADQALRGIRNGLYSLAFRVWDSR